MQGRPANDTRHNSVKMEADKARVFKLLREDSEMIRTMNRRTMPVPTDGDERDTAMNLEGL